MSYLYDGATPWAADSLRLVKTHGGIAVSVYIVGSPGGMRCANAADVKLARSMGFGVVPNWERAADFFRTATLADCKNAGAEALAACRALGFPDDGSVGVPFSFDYQVPASGYGRALDQLAACGDGMGGHYVPLGYAQIDLIEYWAAHGLAGPHWLMGSTWRATSTFTQAEVGSAAVAMVQSHDATGRWLNSLVRNTDINAITQPERLLAWWPDNSPYGADVNLTDKLPNPNGGETTVQACLEAIAVIEKAVQTTLPALAKQVTALQAQVAALAAQNTPTGTVQVTGQLTLGGTK